MLKVIAWFFGIAFLLVMLGFGLNMLGLFSDAINRPIDTARGVGARVMNPDHALQSYRWFHAAYQQVEAKKGQIMLAKQALEAAADERKEARRVELLGLQQGCMNLIGQYNERATRMDTRLFMKPEQLIPGTQPGELRPLPTALELSACQ